jgi:hypothetical protein
MRIVAQYLLFAAIAATSYGQQARWLPIFINGR